jgi:integrase
VKRSISMTKKGIVFVPPKSARGKRNITLTARAVEALKKHNTTQEKEGQWLGNLWEDQRLVFPNQSGKLLHPWILTKRFKRILKEADLPEVRFHDLRHTCATLLLSKGIHPKIAQEILGHSTISITLDTYSHLLPNMQNKAVSAMEEIID